MVTYKNQCTFLNLRAFEDKEFPNRVCKLKKALYGLKQSPRSWYDKINAFLKECGFVNSESDPNMYLMYAADGCVLLALYVDDLVIAASNIQKMEQVKQWLRDRFKMKYLGQ